MGITNSLIYKPNDMVNSIAQIVFQNKGYENFKVIKLFPEIEFFTSAIIRLFLSIQNYIVGMNLMILFFTLINFIVAFFLLRKVTEKVLKANPNHSRILLFSFFLTFNVYYFYRVLSFTPNLLFIGIIFIYLYLVLEPINYLKLIIITLISYTISIYYTIFGLQIYFLMKLLLTIFSKHSLSKLAYSVIAVGTISFIYYLFLQHFIFLNSHKTNTFDNTLDKGVNRPIEDFYSFRFNPKLMLLPPKNSAFFSDELYQRVKISDFDEYEASGIFIGWHYLIALGITIFLVFREIFYKKHFTEYKYLASLLISLVFIILIALPPLITIQGHVVYMPSFYIHRFLPFVRVLARYALVINTLLIINLFIIVEIFVQRHKLSKLTVTFTLLCLALFHFIFNAVDIRVININNPPDFVAFTKSRNERLLIFDPKISFSDKFWFIGTDKFLTESSDFIQSDEARLYVIKKDGTNSCANMVEIYNDNEVKICANKLD